LKAGQRALQTGQQALQTTVEHQGKQLANLQSDVTTLKTDVKGLHGRMDTLELKVEAFHSEQKQANDEILRIIVDASDANGEDHKALEKRVDRIEKHLDLPPVK
jgi:tetrahydromethanopterin S-methyltransferase subunit G